MLSLLYLGLQIKIGRVQSQKEFVDLITKQRGDHIRLLAGNCELAFRKWKRNEIDEALWKVINEDLSFYDKQITFMDKAGDKP